MNQFLDINTEVAEALKSDKPVVALESTIISHGMPYPENFEMAQKVERIIRENGAIPATIGIIGGRLKAGLTEEELLYMAQTPGIIKASRRDLPFIVSQKLDGATTVASTMIVAQMAGIKVFVTGGIGGVHREAETTMDISADLQELAQTDVAVVCAGAKSILDIGLTLEYLETHGVPVLGYGVDEFPAFYTRKSGFDVDYKVSSPEDTAKALHAKWGMGLRGGMVIANPIPEAHALDYDLITAAIENALVEAKSQGIKGKKSTPFLLSKVKAITEGKSLTANLELVYNNAKIGARIAKAYAEQSL